MEPEDISYKTLRKIQQVEKSSPLLTKIESNFYHELSEHIKNLENRLKKEDSSQKKTLLKDEIKNTKKIATNIYELREKKIVTAAISKARGGNPDLKFLVPEEQKLFDSPLHIMMQSRQELLDNKPKKEEKVEVKPVEPEQKEPGKENQENTKPVLMITKDIPEFVGTDTKNYHLRKGDIISLSPDMEEMLSKGGVTKKIEK